VIRPSAAISSVTGPEGVAGPEVLVARVMSSVETLTLALPAVFTETTSRTSVSVVSEVTGTCCEFTTREPETVVWSR
jgi:hypothetical protein